jgi:hypothetical protein
MFVPVHETEIKRKTHNFCFHTDREIYSILTQRHSCAKHTDREIYTQYMYFNVVIQNNNTIAYIYVKIKTSNIV